MTLACTVESGGRKWWILSVTSCAKAVLAAETASAQNRTRKVRASVMSALLLFSRIAQRSSAGADASAARYAPGHCGSCDYFMVYATPAAAAVAQPNRSVSHDAFAHPG